MHGRQKFIRFGRRLAVIAVCCGVPLSTVSAADWQLGASLTEEFIFDDNISLEDGSTDDVWGLSTRPQISLEGRTPRFDLGLSGGLDYSFFEGQDDLDSFDQNASINATYRLERAVFGMIGQFQRATTRTTEVDDSGRDLSDDVRLSFSGAPSWSYLVTPTNRVGLRGGATYVTFDSGSREDFTNFSGGPFWSHQLTEKNTVEFSGSYSRFDRLTGLDLKSDTAGGNAKFSHIFSPRLDGFVNLGGTYVHTKEDVDTGTGTVSRTDNSVGFTGGAGATLKSDRASVTAVYSRSMFPSSDGRLQERDQLSFSGRYKMSPSIAASLSSNFVLQDAIDSGFDTRRAFISAEPGITWSFHKDWNLRMAYRFRTQKLDDDGERVYSNGALASVTWRLPTLPRGGPK